jgi:SAM-dependent methyltransferase
VTNPVRPGGASLPLSSLTNVAAYQDPEWFALYEDLASYSHDVHIFRGKSDPDIYRKGWEWVQTLYGLQHLGMIHPDHRAIGVGAGRECVIFWLGDRIRQVVATDLYGSGDWATSGGREADAAVVENPQKFCPRPIRPEAIEFKVMDGTNLGAYPEATFDFSWSLSSIEHFGSHERAADAVREMARVVRPGGVVVVATEYLLLEDQHHPEFFNQSEMERYVIEASPLLELIEPVDWSLPPTDYLIDSVVYPSGIDRARRHVVLNDGTVQWTSFLAFFRRK